MIFIAFVSVTAGFNDIYFVSCRLFHDSCCDCALHSAVFTATAGSAAEGEVRDPEEPGSLLFYLCRRHGIQGRKTLIHVATVCCEGLHGANSNLLSTGPCV